MLIIFYLNICMNTIFAIGLIVFMCLKVKKERRKFELKSQKNCCNEKHTNVMFLQKCVVNLEIYI